MNDNMLQNMSMADVSVCANCGKEGSDINNVCAKCKQVKYCNAVCKKVHKKKHKKDCEEYQRLATENHNEELRIAAELHDIELFKQPPPPEDCPICEYRRPTLIKGFRYQACCGKTICSGCFYAPVYDNQGNEVIEKVCPFCRVPTPYTDEENIQRLKKRVEAGDAHAIYNLGSRYRDGTSGLPQDYAKALELWQEAGELGYANAYCCIGYAYERGRGVDVDRKKAKHYFELSAIGGDEVARHNLGNDEWRAGNKERALKHWMIAVRDGYANSLETIKQMCTYGRATKDDYMTALQLYQAYLGEIKSLQRDEAAAAREDHRYY